MSSTPSVPSSPAYLVRTPRLLLRCPEPADARRRQEAMDASAAHLAELFPPLAAGEWTLATHVAHVRRSRGGFDTDGDRAYEALTPDGERLLGEGFLLRRAGLGALEVGYWLRADAVGKGTATELSAALVKVAFEVDGVHRLDLTCSPDNARSIAMAKRLGFTLEGRLRERQLAAHHPRADILCFTLLASEYPQTLSHAQPLEAFGLLGERLL
jgi:RimJ/RimL family protein N-acetyltransferase